VTTAHDPPLILLVDDDSDNRSIYATILRAEGFRVLEARSGAEAVPLARTRQPALVIMDLKMPYMDGWQAMELIRANPATADLPVIALSIVGPGEDRRDAVRRGFDAHWGKPMPPGELLSRVRAWLSDDPAQ
jgi:CheY-like chemotaxis protein